MPDLVGDHVGLGEVSGRPEPPTQFPEEVQVQVDGLVRRTVEGTYLGGGESAPGSGRLGEQHQARRPVLVAALPELPLPHALDVIEDERNELHQSLVLSRARLAVGLTPFARSVPELGDSHHDEEDDDPGDSQPGQSDRDRVASAGPSTILEVRDQPPPTPPHTGILPRARTRSPVPAGVLIPPVRPARARRIVPMWTVTRCADGSLPPEWAVWRRSIPTAGPMSCRSSSPSTATRCTRPWMRSRNERAGFGGWRTFGATRGSPFSSTTT